MLTLLVSICGSARAQNVGIGTNAPDASALLDLTSTTMGLLAPRVTTGQMNAILNPARGLLVFNTTAVNFYYNAGTAALPNWTPFLTGTTGWTLTGNAGTTPGTNFLGTTDANDLVFKTNGTERMRLLSGGNIGIGTAAPLGALDISPSISAVAGSTSFPVRSDATLSGVINGAQTGLYSVYSVPTVNLSGGASNTLTSLYNNYAGLTATAGTITNYYGSYIAAPTGSGTVSNKYGVVTESGAGNNGMGTTAPNVKLDVNGDIAWRYGSFMASNGANSNIAIGSYSFVRVSGPNAAFSISGFSGGQDGKVLVLYNSTTQKMTLNNDNAGSTAANRIYTLNPSGNGDITIAGHGSLTMIYSAADSRWLTVAPPTSSTTFAPYSIKRKTSNQSVTSSATLTNDNDLTFTIGANEVMEIDGFLDAYSASAGPDIKIGFTVPAGATMDVGYHCSFNGNTQANLEIGTLTTSGTASNQIQLNGTNSNPIFIHGIIANGATAGTVQLQFAQFTSSATATQLQTNSYLKVTTVQ